LVINAPRFGTTFDELLLFANEDPFAVDPPGNFKRAVLEPKFKS
jgi:hypothetical protein